MQNKIEEALVPRKSTRLEKKKPMQTPSLEKRVKKTSSGPSKRRKTLQIYSFKFEEETSDRPIQLVE